MLRLKSRGHVSYYRAVMKSDAARSDEGAVGSHTHESWLKIGQMQFDYLVAHGLKPGMRMLEIGCGNLRAGRLFIDHLDAGLGSSGPAGSSRVRRTVKPGGPPNSVPSSRVCACSASSAAAIAGRSASALTVRSARCSRHGR